VLKKPQNWTGNRVFTLEGSETSSIRADFDFTINVDGSIAGDILENNQELFEIPKMSLAMKEDMAFFYEYSKGKETPTTIALTGKLDESNNMVSLVEHYDKIRSNLEYRSPQLEKIMSLMKPPSVPTREPAPGMPPSLVGDWPFPPIERVSGGTVSIKTGTDWWGGDEHSTTVYTIYPALEIIRTDRTDASFLADRSQLSFVVKVNKPGIDPNTANWTVTGTSTDSGNGDPHTANNASTFRFTPNPTNRLTTGSTVPNDPISYNIEVTVGGLSEAYELKQDPTDIIRQEYVDFQLHPPAREEIMAPTNNAFNTGNYALIVDRGMQRALDGTISQFERLSAPGAPPASVTVSSGYRNPRKNIWVKSVHLNSRHVWGSALDLVANPANVGMWTRLRQAGQSAGYTSICEHGGTQIQCDDPAVNHVHIQW
jgi:hypothetical protein